MPTSVNAAERYVRNWMALDGYASWNTIEHKIGATTPIADDGIHFLLNLEII